MFDAHHLNWNLINDGFFNDTDGSLKIIDDYHTKGITDEAIRFYKESFEGTGLKKIEIYYQIKKLSDKVIKQINVLAEKLEVNRSDFLSFIVFALTSIPKNCDIEQAISESQSQKTIRKNIETSENFVKSMADIRIEVEYHPYSSLGLKPPFHGRYWLNEKKGYIVDASLNTYGKGKIFAQLMDCDNHNLIWDLFENEILPNGAYKPLSIDTIESIRSKLRSYYCEFPPY